MDRGTWQATVHEVTKSQTRLSMCTHTKMELSSSTGVSNLSGIRDRFCGRQFFHSQGWGVRDGSGSNERNEGRQTKLCVLRHSSPPAVPEQVMDRHQSAARAREPLLLEVVACY